MLFDKSPSVCTQERVKYVIRTTHPPMRLPTSTDRIYQEYQATTYGLILRKIKVTQQKQLIWGHKALTEFAASGDDLLLSRTASCTQDCWSSLVQWNQGLDRFKRLGELNRPRNRAGSQGPHKPIITADFSGKSGSREKEILSCTPLEHVEHARSKEHQTPGHCKVWNWGWNDLSSFTRCHGGNRPRTVQICPQRNGTNAYNWLFSSYFLALSGFL